MTKIKHKKSPVLAAVRAEWSKPLFDDQRSRDVLAQILDYPHNGRAEVFCWLWVNHAELSEMRHSLRLRPTWRGVAQIMAQDGVKGRHGAAPTGNAVRRVWGRVCQEIEAKQAKKAQ